MAIDRQADSWDDLMNPTNPEQKKPVLVCVPFQA
jgi:hypothetical protein